MHPFKHLKVILKHRHQVIRHCFRAGIGWQGLRHDLSKFSPEEFIAGARYFQGSRSPNEGEREAVGYSRAWMHHKGRNKHHFEYWTDYDPVKKQMRAVPMPVRYAAEMFCDRVAASKVYLKENYNDGSALAYFQRGKANRSIHPETSALLESWLVLLSEEGEQAAFAAVRQKVSARAPGAHLPSRRKAF